MKQIYSHLASSLNLSLSQVEAGLSRLKLGATPAFIARYRSQEVKALTEQQLQQLTTEYTKLQHHETRKATIETTLRHLEKLSPSLHENITACTDPVALEQFYSPFKPNQAMATLTKSQAQLIKAWRVQLGSRGFESHEALQEALNHHEFSNATSVTAIFIIILLEQAINVPAWVLKARDLMLTSGNIQTSFADTKVKSHSKYRDFDAHEEPIAQLEPCRALTILSGRREAALKLSIALPTQTIQELIQELAQHLLPHNNSSMQAWVAKISEELWSNQYKPLLETICLQHIKQQAENSMLEDIKAQTEQKLLAKPYPDANVLGVYPGLKTGVKLAVINSNHELKHHTIIHPHAPQNAWQKGKRTLKQLLTMGKVDLIAISHGEGAYEAYQLIQEVLQECSNSSIEIKMVSSCGLNALALQSEIQQEWSHLDVHLRCAGMVAKRVRQPLTEWFKVSPQMMADNPYLAELNPVKVEQVLDASLQHAVHRQAHDLNKIDASCLQRISGLNNGLAQQILAYKARHGRFHTRQDLLKVPFMTPERFEQCAGFLCVYDGDEFLDTTQVHPEAYADLKQAAQAINLELSSQLTDQQKTDLAAQLQAQGMSNIAADLWLKQLSNQAAPYLPEANQDKDIQVIHISDLKPNMMLQGIVSNVATFGAFIDIGLDQKGLIHISEMGERFIDDPRKVIKTGDFVKVKVKEVDIKRERINLSMKLRNQAPKKTKTQPRQPQQKAKAKSGHQPKPNLKNEAMASAFADAFAKLKS